MEIFFYAIFAAILLLELYHWLEIKETIQILYYGKKQYEAIQTIKSASIILPYSYREKLVQDFVDNYKVNEDRCSDCLSLLSDSKEFDQVKRNVLDKLDRRQLIRMKSAIRSILNRIDMTEFERWHNYFNQRTTNTNIITSSWIQQSSPA